MKLAIFAILGGLVGFGGSFIPWGAPERLHGVGLPIAAVLWDAPNGVMIDYLNPMAYLLNPLIGSLIGGCLFGVSALFRRKPEK